MPVFDAPRRTDEGGTMSTATTLHFPVSVAPRGRRRVRSEAPGKSALGVTAPPEFGGPDGSLWSPEDLLVNAVASCYALTLGSVARRLRVPLRDVNVRAVGDLERQSDGPYGFSRVELDVEFATDEGMEEVAERAAAVAKEQCLVGRALGIPVQVRVSVT
jgi:organic hydroperoxide reductase OsmC/OhrA